MHETGPTRSETATDSSDRLRALGRSLWSASASACWRDGCTDCPDLEVALQSVGSALGATATLFEDAARDALLGPQELARESSTPATRFATLVHVLDAAVACLRTIDEPELSVGAVNQVRRRGAGKRDLTSHGLD